MTVIAGWLCPGAGHLLHGQAQKAVVLFVALVTMFVAGIGFGGRLFSLQFGDVFVLLPALAEWGMGLPRLVALLGDFGRGEVTAATYEYGNTFLIASGLLNMIVTLNALDLTSGRKPQ